MFIENLIKETFFNEVRDLQKKFPNDMDFGKEVRKLIYETQDKLDKADKIN